MTFLSFLNATFVFEYSMKLCQRVGALMIFYTKKCISTKFAKTIFFCRQSGVKVTVFVCKYDNVLHVFLDYLDSIRFSNTTIINNAITIEARQDKHMMIVVPRFLTFGSLDETNISANTFFSCVTWVIQTKTRTTMALFVLRVYQ